MFFMVYHGLSSFSLKNCPWFRHPEAEHAAGRARHSLLGGSTATFATAAEHHLRNSAQCGNMVEIWWKTVEIWWTYGGKLLKYGGNMVEIWGWVDLAMKLLYGIYGGINIQLYQLGITMVPFGCQGFDKITIC